MDACCLGTEVIGEFVADLQMKMPPLVPLLPFRGSRPDHFKRSCWRGKAPPPRFPFLRNGTVGSPTHSCGSGAGLPQSLRRNTRMSQGGGCETTST